METLTSHAGRATRAWRPDERAHADGRIAGRFRRKLLRRWSSTTGDARSRFTRGWPAAAASLIERWSTLPAAGHEVLREDGVPLRAGLGARLSPAGRRLRRAVEHDARWPRDVVRCRRDLRGGGSAGRPPLRRCRDGWSEFF
ncbi:putative serine incorporator [Dorcoceras hygrometricum]|uniref:Putative serine incorporator n=1 Tax=Dorcoceras hygrometricum TaxID=472368 RepID=A0A2Z6ZU23_9LAMI|nr:putative serine incorporator [Dorcoceras hygrometricum]